MSSSNMSEQYFTSEVLRDWSARRRYHEASEAVSGHRIEPDLYHESHPILQCSTCEAICFHTHEIFVGASIARKSLVRVAKDLWRGDSQKGAYTVAEYDLSTGDIVYDTVLASSVDARRHLWLQIADSRWIGNWPKGQHPNHHTPAYAQRRIEIDLDPLYRASEVELRLGAAAKSTFIGVSGLTAVIVRDKLASATTETANQELVAA